MRDWSNGIAAQIGSALLTVIAVATIVFSLIHAVPGDPVDVLLGEYASTSDRAAIRTRLGLDAPLSTQWWHFLNGAVRLDFGESLLREQAVNDLLWFHLRYTALLAASAFVIAIAVGIPLGIIAATRVGGLADRGAMVLALLGLAVPNFVLGPVFIWIFAIHFGWLPAGGADSGAALILPALTLGISMAALLARMTRATMLEVINQPYMIAARARGLSSWSLNVHAMRNVALPVVTVMGLQLGALLGGAVITEAVFGWPGIGLLLVDAIQQRDYPVVQACVLVISLTYVGLNLVTEFVYRWLDPRVRC